jgi:hypothetical protein
MSAWLLLTAIAMIAVFVAWRGVAALAARSVIAARLRTLLVLIAALLGLRVLAGFHTDRVTGTALMMTACWLPMAGLRLTEELQRRHAPGFLKYAALGGAAGLSIVALANGWNGVTVRLLAGYQAAVTAAMAVLLWRSRNDLVLAERRTADTFLLTLLLTIPLAATDFQELVSEAPVRGGTFAVLTLLLAAARLASGHGTPRQLAADIAIIGGVGGLTMLAAWAVYPQASFATALNLAAIGVAISALLLLIERFTQLRLHEAGIIPALARVPDGRLENIISAHPTLASGRILGASELAGYPAASLARLAQYRVISAEIADASAGDAARDLLDAVAATHLLRLSRDPPSFLAISVGGLTGPGFDGELEIAARLMEKA